MKVKIGNKIYNPDDEPIMIILTKKDKENISNMLDDAFRYCSYPDDGYTQEDIKKFMEIEE